MSKVSDEAFEANLREHAIGYGAHVVGALLIEAADRIQSLRSASTPAKAVKVKPLEWDRTKPDWYADSVVGQYGVGKIGAGGYSVILRRVLDGRDEDELLARGKARQAAVAVAEAHYTQAIISALEDAPQQEVVGYVRQETLDKLREGDAGPIVGIAAFDTVIPLYALSHPSTPATGSENE